MNSSVKNEIGVVFDECNFHEFFTAQNMAQIFSGVYSTWDNSLFTSYMKKINVPFSKPIGSFSKGMKMKQKIADYVILIHQGKIILFLEKQM